MSPYEMYLRDAVDRAFSRSKKRAFAAEQAARIEIYDKIKVELQAILGEGYGY